MTANPDRFIGKTLGYDKYHLKERLGGGAFGTVYRATRRTSQQDIQNTVQDVAVKILMPLASPEEDDFALTLAVEVFNFSNEAQRISALAPHENIVPLIELAFDPIEAVFYFVMPIAEEGSLKRHIRRGVPLPPSTVISFIEKAAKGLDHAHEKKIVHRDVKPDNLLLPGHDGLWVSDFGIAVESHSLQSLPPIKQIGGTVPYMAPEQFDGKPTKFSDIYGLAVVTYEGLTGRRPFEGNALQIEYSHRHTPPPPFSEKGISVDDRLRVLETEVLKALAKDPEKRPSRATIFAQTLKDIAQEKPHGRVFEGVKPKEDKKKQIDELLNPRNRATPLPTKAIPASNPPPHQSFTQPALPQPIDITSPYHTAPDKKIVILPEDKSSQSRPIAYVTITPPLPHRTRSHMTINLLFASLALLLIVSSIFLYPIVLNNYFISPKATATSVHANTTSLPRSAVIATTAAQAYAAGTTQQGVMFGFDPAHTNWNRYERVLNVSTVSHLKLLWSYTTGAPIYYSSPTVAGGMVYVSSEDHKLYAFDATCWQACQPLWSYTTGNSIESSPAVAGGMLYILSADQILYAFDATCRQACQPLWRYTTGNPISSYDASPVVAGGMLYISSYEGKLYAFDATCRQTCQPLWSYTTGNPIYDSSPAVAGGMLYIRLGDGKLYAFDATCRRACQPLWSYTNGSFIESSPTIAGGMVYIGSENDSLYAFDATCRQACQPLWSYANGSSTYSPSAVAGGILYISLSDGKLYAFDATCRQACQPLWSYTTRSSTYSSPAVAGDVVYVSSEDHKLYAFDATCRRACQPLWSYTIGSSTYGSSTYTSPTVAGGMLYICLEDHKLYAFGLAS